MYVHSKEGVKLLGNKGFLVKILVLSLLDTFPSTPELLAQLQSLSDYLFAFLYVTLR